ncbi:MAG TPA: AAA family ATPase [Demequinaceae bacterium]
MSSQRGADLPSIEGLRLLVLAAPARLGRTRLVLVDGPAGSGKTSLAGRLAAALGCDILHGDDMYEGWGGLPTLWETLGEQVLEPLARGEAARFRRWDWARGERAEWIEVEAVDGRGADALVVEGVGVAGRRARPYASLGIYVEAPRDVRLARGVERDGEALRDEWLRWEAAEAPVLLAEGTREASDLIIDGTIPVPD